MSERSAHRDLPNPAALPDLSVSVSDGARSAIVSWDAHRGTYRAEIDLVPHPPGAGRARAQTSDMAWAWLSDPRAAVLPDRLAVGHRFAELVTIDSLVNRLRTSGFKPDRPSLRELLRLRSAVSDRCGSVVFLGRVRLEGRSSSPNSVRRDLLLGFAGGRTVPIAPRFDHPDHEFGWGRRCEATLRTARFLIDMAWSTARDAATEAAVADLAISVLAEMNGGFVWRAESIADWVATETGDLADGSVPPAALKAGERRTFHQLSLELR